MTGRRRVASPAGVAVTLVGGLMATWCAGFAVVSIVFELTGHFDDGPYAAYASGISVMNWLVVVLKLAGAAVALLSVARSPRLPPAVLAVALWGVFTTLGVYVLGSMVQAVGMLAGVTGEQDRVDLAGVGYVTFFLLAAAGFGVLATSFSRRHALGWRLSVLGAFGAPVVLGTVLLAVPALLAALGLLPS